MSIESLHGLFVEGKHRLQKHSSVQIYANNARWELVSRLLCGSRLYMIPFSFPHTGRQAVWSPTLLQCSHVREGTDNSLNTHVPHVCEDRLENLNPSFKCTNVICRATTVPAALQPSKIFTSLALSRSLSCNLFPFYPSPHPSPPQPPPSGEPFHTFLLSPFHMEEQLLWRSSLCLSLSLSALLSHTSSRRHHSLRSGGNHTVWTKCATNLSDDVCFPPLAVPLFQHECVLTLSTYLTKCCDTRCTRMSAEWKFAASLLKWESAGEGGESGGQTESQGSCDYKVCMFRQLVSIFVKTISKQPIRWGSQETLNKGYFAENQRCLRDRTAAFLQPKTVAELHRETNTRCKKLYKQAAFYWGHYFPP